MTASTQNAADPVESLVERLFAEGAGSLHLLTLYLGERLGLFRILADSPGLTAEQLARAASIDERYAVERLQAETMAGLIVADGTDFRQARFTVPETLVIEHPFFRFYRLVG